MEVLTTAGTGVGGELLILDDPLSAEEARSDAERDRQNRIVTEGLLTRLDSQVSGRVVLVQQRLHMQDTTAVLMATGDFTSLSLSAEVLEKPERVYFPISKREKIRAVGDVLDPERLPKPVLQSLERSLGPYAYAGQYLQKPAPLKGGIIDVGWWKWYDYAQVDRIAASSDFVVISVDPNLKVTEVSCDAAVQAWACLGSTDSYLIDRRTEKVHFAGLVSTIEVMATKWKTRRLLIEATAVGPAVISQLRDKGFIILSFTPTKDKVARLSAASIQIQAGTVYLPHNAEGLRIQELAATVPAAPWDDMDSMSQFLNWRHDHGDPCGWLKAMALEEERHQRGERPDDDSAYAGRRPPSVKEIYDDMRRDRGEKVCIQPADDGEPVVSVPAASKSTVVCPKCGSHRVFLAGAMAKCKEATCHLIFKPTRVGLSK
jgi:predicted phage terminase large subunit-like protein